MPQNKLKMKVEALTRVVQQLINEVQKNSSMSQGTLTALQLSVGKEEWTRIVDELKEIEGKASEPEDKKLEL
tara:strand:+ start:1085 stop:1300 length:216 start_codon:yes stop_codon:yes gene_type:complete